MKSSTSIHAEQTARSIAIREAATARRHLGQAAAHSRLPDGRHVITLRGVTVTIVATVPLDDSKKHNRRPGVAAGCSTRQRFLCSLKSTSCSPQRQAEKILKHSTGIAPTKNTRRWHKKRLP
jgi:hypothetical protein